MRVMDAYRPGSYSERRAEALALTSVRLHVRPSPRMSVSPCRANGRGVGGPDIPRIGPAFDVVGDEANRRGQWYRCRSSWPGAGAALRRPHGIWTETSPVTE